MTMAFDPGATPVIVAIQYAVNATGDTLFQPTIGLSDSPDYSTAPDKANAVAQCTIMSPLSEEVVA